MSLGLLGSGAGTHLHLKGSKPEAATAGWSLVFVPGERVPVEPSLCSAMAEESLARALWDRSMVDLAGRQHGVVARRQLLALGMSRHVIDRRVSRGLLRVVHLGVY